MSRCFPSSVTTVNVMGNLAARNKCAQSNLSLSLSALRASSWCEGSLGVWFINHLISHMLFFFKIDLVIYP